jgi:PAS domain S-box-containing protein
MAEVLDAANRKQQAATEAIIESEERVRMLVEHMPVGLIAIDKEGTILSANPRTEKIFCYPVADLKGKNLQMLFADNADSHPQTFMQMIRQKAFGRTAELTARRLTSETFPSDIAVDELQTKNGVQLLVNVQDVTDRHEAERLKREFVAMVSHDLRTPLTSLLGSLTLLAGGAMGELPPEAQSTVATAESDVERLMRLINDLLDVARIEAGKMEMTFDTVALDSVISRSIDSVRPFADTSQIAILARPSNLRVIADGDRLVQVVVNLLSNAVKFSPPASNVEVSVQEMPGWVEVQVQDHGRGVPEEYRQAIFERFQQVSSEDSRAKKGTGLGLPICKTIIEQHGGTIGVRSASDGGSVFWFRLQCTAVSGQA